MSQSTRMKTALKKHIITPLMDKGFEGKYPHYKKVYDNRIELLSFITNKHGNSFNIEISTIFLPSSKRNSNFISADFNDYYNADISHTNYRYRLKGMYDGWFYYSDLYLSKIGDIFDYNAVSETKALNYIPRSDEKLIQKADDETYQKVCEEINRQMEYAFKWWDAFNKNNKIKLWFLNRKN